MEQQAPEVIYLQYAPDGETTWCEDKINKDDVRYVRADLVDAQRAALIAIRDETHWNIHACRDKAAAALSDHIRDAHPEI